MASVEADARKRRYLTSFEREEAELSEAFKQECRTLRRLRHRNVLRFYGAGTAKDGRLFAVLELMEMGSLRLVLDRDDERLAWPVRQNVALQVRLWSSAHAIPLSVNVKPPSVGFSDTRGLNGV